MSPARGSRGEGGGGGDGEEGQHSRPHFRTLQTWLALLRPGDGLVIALGLAGVIFLFTFFWQGGGAEKALVRRDGKVVAELDLTRRKSIEVEGAIGISLITVEPGRARVAADPGPRQYCVRQGWLTRPGEIAICAPNHISLQIAGGRSRYDSTSY